MVSGAEGERRLDLDADAVGRNAGAIVGAVNEKPAGPDRLQASKADFDPILRCEALEAELLCGARSDGCRD